MILVVKCSEGPAYVPSTIVMCDICKKDCWLSKASGVATLTLGKATGDTRIVCLDCLDIVLGVKNGE